VAYRPDCGYAQDGVAPALAGTYAFTLADGKAVPCWPAQPSRGHQTGTPLTLYRNPSSAACPDRALPRHA
jgi:hypothetical protein